MVKLIVKVDFKDKETLKRHFVGETIEREDARAKELIAKKVCIEVFKIQEFKGTDLVKAFNKVTKPKNKKDGL